MFGVVWLPIQEGKPTPLPMNLNCLKEEENKPILKKAIKQVALENIKQIGEWRKKYPDCTYSDSIKNDMYLKIVGNSMSGLTTEEQVKNVDKIISKVAKESIIDKESVIDK